MQATLACVEKNGLAKTSVEDIAAEAGLSRATVYRYFPGGRGQLISETVTWEVGNFLQGIGEAVADERGLDAKLRQALLVGHRAIVEHKLLHQILSTEPEALFKELAESEPLLFAVVRDYLKSQLEAKPLRPGIDVDEAAEYVARLFLSSCWRSPHAV